MKNDFTLFLNNVPEMVYAVQTGDDPLVGIFLYVSAYVEIVLGYSPNEFIEDPNLWFSLIHPDDIPGLCKSSKEMYETRKTVPRTYRILHKNQHQYILLMDKASLIFDDDKKITGYVGTAQDITSLHATELKNKLLISTVEQSADCVMITDQHGFIEFVNSSFEKETGYSREYAIGKRPNILKSGHHDKTFYEKLWHTILKSEPFQDVFINKRKNGEVCYEVKTITPIKDHGGKITHYVSTAKDITELMKTEELLRQSEERYKTIIDKSLEAIYICDPVTLKIMNVNPAFYMLLGYSEKDLDSLYVYDIVRHPREEIENNFQRILSEGAIDMGERVWMKKNGMLIHTHVTGCKIRHEKKDILCIVSRDVTQRKVLQAQLLQAQKMESLGTLAGGIAHDFNNILGIVLGHSTLLEHKLGDREQFLRSLDSITKATQRGASLVKQLLTFARETEQSFKPIRVNDVVNEIMKLVKETFPKNITISAILNGELPCINADFTQLHQVVLNLCVNARDAMPDGGILTLATSIVYDEKLKLTFPTSTEIHYVCIEVSDTGTGMDDATRVRIFEPFFTTKDVGKGTGLGLAMVFSIIETHNGFIDVQSVPGKGTSFKVYLPVHKNTEQLNTTTVELKKIIRGGTETILLVEDEELLSQLVQSILVLQGYTVLTAKDGIEALEVFREKQPEIHLVLSDIGLPKMSGDQLYNHIKEINPEMKIILASGYIDPATKTKMVNSGMSNFINKPYSHDEILEKVREMLDKL